MVVLALRPEEASRLKEDIMLKLSFPPRNSEEMGDLNPLGIYTFLKVSKNRDFLLLKENKQSFPVKWFSKFNSDGV